MSKIGFLFPGQGSQFVGMGQELIAASPLARKIYDQANQILGFSLSRVILEGPEEELKKTDVAQPAILTATAAAWAVFQEKRQVDPADCVAAGHSLGEYGALLAAGVIDFEQGLKFVRRRGELMQAAALAAGGGMAAVLGLDEPEVLALCQEADTAGGVQVANLNSPGQIVVSGSQTGLNQFVTLAKDRKIRVIPLPVSGPFHSRFMQPAADQLAGDFAQTNFKPARFPVISNVSAEPQTDPDAIREALVKQVTGSVRWEASMRRMQALGATRLFEIGPGKVLKGLQKKIEPALKVISVFSPAEIETAAEELSHTNAA